MSSIKAFGILWERSLYQDDHHWIYGWRPKYEHWRRQPEQAEFILNDQPAIYVLYGPNEEIVYIGQTGSKKAKLGNRLWHHANGRIRTRWTKFSWFGLKEPTPYYEGEPAGEAVPDEEVSDDFVDSDSSIGASLFEIEAMLITLLEPRLNQKSGNWKNSLRLEQYSYSDRTDLEHVWDALEEIKAALKVETKC